MIWRRYMGFAMSEHSNDTVHSIPKLASSATTKGLVRGRDLTSVNT